MLKIEAKHIDILGQPLSVNNYIAVAHHNNLYICSIIKITPKQVRVKPISSSGKGWLKYPSEMVLLSGPDALVYILKHAGA